MIGINAMIFGGDLGVAIPSHIATQFLAVAEGHQPVLGVAVQPVELPVALQAAAQREQGLLVVGIKNNSSAARAPLYIGDVLLDIDHKPVGDAHTLKYALAQHTGSASIALRVLRGGTLRMVDVALDAPRVAQVAA